MKLIIPKQPHHEHGLPTSYINAGSVMAPADPVSLLWP